MKKFLLFTCVTLITVNAFSMQQPQPASLLSLPSDVHMHIIKNTINNTYVNEENRYFLERCEIDACKDIRALARTNTYFYTLINNPRNTHAMICQIANRCEFPRLTGAIQLKTKGAKQWVQDMASQDRSGETDKELAHYLFEAAELNANQRIAFLLSCVPNLKEVKNHKGDTPLITASREGLLKSVQTLLKAGADVNYTNLAGFTALQVAVNKTEVEIVKELLKAGAIVRNDRELYDAMQKDLKAQKNAILAEIGQDILHGEVDHETALKLMKRKDPKRTEQIVVDLIKATQKKNQSSKCSIQ